MILFLLLLMLETGSGSSEGGFKSSTRRKKYQAVWYNSGRKSLLRELLSHGKYEFIQAQVLLLAHCCLFGPACLLLLHCY